MNSSLPLPERNLQIIFDKEEEEALIVLRAMLLGLTEIQSKVAAQLKVRIMNNKINKYINKIKCYLLDGIEQIKRKI